MIYFSFFEYEYDYFGPFLHEPLPGPQVCIKNTPKGAGVYVEGPLLASNLNFWIRKQTFSSGLGLIKHDAGEILNYFFNHSNCAVSGNTDYTC